MIAKTILVHGTNSEPSFIGSSICAERSALVKLRFFASSSINKIIIVTDHNLPISPGLLCREYIASYADPNIIILCGNSNGSNISKCKISDLYPNPCIYRKSNRDTLITTASEISQIMSHPKDYEIDKNRIKNINNNDIINVYNKALEYTKYDNTDNIHPLRYASACLFSNGVIECCY